ncbi:hypothetical protein DL769_005588 [Monosporascus sp. CRB-8-3]|nr:hypothetical protein DL769_005588 [Monosporascus sp. CRB-8-3]
MAVARPGEAKSNGRNNGHANGSLKKASKSIKGANGLDSAVSRRIPKKQTGSGFFVRSFHVAARLLTWYSIITILFRCPSSLNACTESSPAICKPYFQLKQAVSPHLGPYYDAYAAPYVDMAKPYYETFDRAVVTPGRTYAIKYGGPKLAQAQAYGQVQWEKQVQPQVAKFQSLARHQYDQTVSPYVAKASVVLGPYYDIAKANAFQTYHELLLPTYSFIQPYLLHSYDAVYAFTKDAVVPSTVWAGNKAYLFLDSTIWPRLRDVYTATVEPQLVRIGERLGRYNRKKTRLTAEDIKATALKSTFAKPSSSVASPTSAPSVTAAKTSTQVDSTSTVTNDAMEPQETVGEVKTNVKKSSSTPEEVRELAAKTVAEDLELWKGKFAQVAEEGANGIEEQIDEISTRMIERQSVMGRSLLTQLDETVKSELSRLRPTILTILKKGGDDTGKIGDEVATAVRAAGLKIKNKAQDVRAWRQNYEQETEIAVTKAAQEHFAIIEETRDLALQKIGMKWAWMDGVTYKDWKKFHDLRAQFNEWTDELKRLVTTHPGLVAAQKVGTDIEDQAMSIAQQAAEELGRLKRVASWKAVARDYSEDFDTDTMKLAAEAAQQKIAATAKKAAENVEDVAGSVVEGVESASEGVREGISRVISPDAKDTAIDSLSETDSETSAVPPMESLTAEAVESANDLSSSIISSSVSSSSPSNDDIDTEISDPEPVEPLQTSEHLDGPEQIQETIVETPDGQKPMEDADTEPDRTASVKPALFGAAAQAVPSRQPILDDDIIESASSSLSSAASVVRSDFPDGITSAAQSAYTVALAKAAEQYSSAMSAVSAQISGEPKPAHEELFSSVSVAYFSAVAAANSRLSEASAAASRSIYGAPTTKWIPNSMPVPSNIPSVDWERVHSIAQHNWQDSVNWAGEQYASAKNAISDQYESAKVAIGAAGPTPSTQLENVERRAQKLLDQAKHNYYAGLGMAHARYSDFLSAASTAVSSLTASPTPTDLKGSASLAASVASESASSVASAANEAAGSAASYASDAAESVVDSVTGAASDASDKIAESWEYIITQVSSQVYGAPTPTPWYQNLYEAASDYAETAGDAAHDYASAAGDYASSAADAAADQYSAVTSAAGDYAGSAGDAASSQYSVVSSLVSELIVGKEPTFTESVYSRLARALASGSSSASSFASAASETVASAASGATDAAECVIDRVKDEL